MLYLEKTLNQVQGDDGDRQGAVSLKDVLTFRHAELVSASLGVMVGCFIVKRP